MKKFNSFLFRILLIMATAGKEAERYSRLKAQLEDLTQKARRNHYHLKLLSAINDFQVTSASMLLDLRDCDTADKKKRVSGVEKVRQALKEFDHAWKNLQKIYEETRVCDE